jgi:transposase
MEVAMRVVKQVDVPAADRIELERVVSAASSEVRMVERARIVLASAEGLKGSEVAARVGCSEPTVVKWRGRYARQGMDGLRDAPRPGPPLTHGPETRALLIIKACTRPPATPEGRRDRWTYEQLGKAVGMSASQAHVILTGAAIKPHLPGDRTTSTFDRPQSEERHTVVRGVHVHPPKNVLVVSIDGKGGTRNKASTKPDPSSAPRSPSRGEDEYKRNGVQFLFAALKAHRGDLVAMPSHTRYGFDLIRFLEHLDTELPVIADEEFVAISDSPSTRTTPEVKDWLAVHPRWSLRCAPTHASWLNQIEIVLSIMYQRLLKHGTLTSGDDLAQQLLVRIETYNQTGRPFKWTYDRKTVET